MKDGQCPITNACESHHMMPSPSLAVLMQLELTNGFLGLDLQDSNELLYVSDCQSTSNCVVMVVDAIDEMC